MGLLGAVWDLLSVAVGLGTSSPSIRGRSRGADPRSRTLNTARIKKVFSEYSGTLEGVDNGPRIPQDLDGDPAEMLPNVFNLSEKHKSHG